MADHSGCGGWGCGGRCPCALGPCWVLAVPFVLHGALAFPRRLGAGGSTSAARSWVILLLIVLSFLVAAATSPACLVRGTTVVCSWRVLLLALLCSHATGACIAGRASVLSLLRAAAAPPACLVRGRWSPLYVRGTSPLALLCSHATGACIVGRARLHVCDLTLHSCGRHCRLGVHCRCLLGSTAIHSRSSLLPILLTCANVARARRPPAARLLSDSAGHTGTEVHVPAHAASGSVAVPVQCQPQCQYWQ
jgi:hypothetical protein